MEINIMDYVSEDEIKRTILASVENKVREMKESDLERIYTNACYHAVTEASDRLIQEKGLEFSLESKVKKVIEDLSSFTVFYQGNYPGGRNSKAYNLMQSIVEEEKDLLRSKVKELISKAYKERAADLDVAELMSEYVHELFSRPEAE